MQKGKKDTEVHKWTHNRCNRFDGVEIARQSHARQVCVRLPFFRFNGETVVPYLTNIIPAQVFSRRTKEEESPSYTVRAASRAPL